MATKDWKKGIGLEWKNNNSGDLIVIDSPKTSYRKDYVFIYPSDKAIRKFKTKLQALKFAKSYMRTH